MSDAHPSNVARGLKGSLNNSRVSDEAKASVQERLDQLMSSGELDSEDAYNQQAQQGHKAAINNPNVGEEAKERSRQMVDDM